MENSTQDFSAGFKNYIFERYPGWLLTLNGVFGLTIAIVGVLANVLTILVFARTPKIRNAAAYFIISLSAGDLVFCLLVLPLTALRLLRSQWVDNQVLCTMMPFLGYANVGSSLFSVVLITFNRYIKIAHYHVHDRVYEPRYIAMMIAGAWLLAYGIQLPTLFGIWGKFGYDSNQGVCDIVPDVNGNSSKVVIVGIGFVLPCVVLILSYARILFVVKMSERRMLGHVVNVETKRKREELKRTKMVFIIFVTFVVCFLPIAIIRNVDQQVNYPGLHVLGYILLNASCFINPVIYVLMNKTYRQAYRSTLQTVLCVCNRERDTNPVPAAKQETIDMRTMDSSNI